MTEEEIIRRADAVLKRVKEDEKRIAEEPILDKDSRFFLFLLVVGFLAFTWALISIALDNHNCGL